MESIKYPIGVQSFDEIRNGSYLYVDKTAYIHQIVASGKYYFLSRPRRFGKSLMLSTIEALFKAKRHLFKGLAIDSLPWEWVEYPVIHIDLNVQDYKRAEDLTERLDLTLRDFENSFDIGHNGYSAELRFEQLIHKIYETTGRGVVILIDNSDKPLLDTLYNQELREKYRNQLQAFYCVLKSADQYIKFAMLTGVSKIGNNNIFGGLNNLTDISLYSRYNSLCGINEAELETYFRPNMEEMARSLGISYESMHDQLKDNYNGYHFSTNLEDIYNPFSLLNTFESKTIGTFWFSAVPHASIIKLLESGTISIYQLEGYRCNENFLTESDIHLFNPIPIFYQAGYLTIKDYDREYREFILGFSNREVSEGFSQFLLKSYAPEQSTNIILNEFVRDVRQGDAEGFMKRLQSFLADCPYDHDRGDKEKHFQNIIFTIFKLMGFMVETEYRTSDGRIDMIVKTREYIYIIEFKLKGTARKALDQINEKRYDLPFLTDGRKIIKIGAAFSPRTRRLSRWLIE